MNHYHIEDDIAHSELKDLLYVDKEPFSIVKDTINTSQYSFTLAPAYNKTFKELQYYNDLIFGKDKTLEVIAVEVQDNKLVLFKQNEVETRELVFWCLSNERIDVNFKKQDGDQHYKYLRLFSSKDAMARYVQLWKSQRKDIYCIWNDKQAAMTYYGITSFKGLMVSDVSVLSFDIESDGLTHHKDSKVFLITNTFKKDGNIVKKHFRSDEYNEQYGDMINDWCKWVREINPDIINGWNIFGYDIPYLDHVASLYGVKLKLGRDGSSIKVKRNDKEYRVDGSTTWSYKNIEIFGRHIVDGMFLAVKYGVGKEYPSWGLKPIAEAEGLVKSDRQFYDASTINKNWWIPEEREKIVQYGIDDSDDALHLYELMITSYFYTCQSLPLSFQDMLLGATGGWVNSVMVRSYLQLGHSIAKADEAKRVAGGMSYGIPGVYSNVLKWDAASYYPSTILTFNIHNKAKDPNNHFVEMVRFFTEGRLHNKKLYKETNDKYYDDLQAAGKIFINSSYGALSTSGLNYNGFDEAALVTACCRAGLQKAIEWATNKTAKEWWNEYEEEQDFLNYDFIDTKTKLTYQDMPKRDYKLINLDTDSLSFSKQDETEFTEQEIESISNELNQIMYCNWEDDGEFSRVVVLKAKNYCLLPKGKGKIKVKGSALRDAKKEPILLEMISEIIDSLVYAKTNPIDIYRKYIKLALNIKDIKPWAIRKSITKNLLNGTRKNETKVLDAIGDLTDIREGDKVYLFNKIEGEVQVVVKGEPQFFKKTGEPKMEPNHVLKLVKDFDGDYDKLHYVDRVYATIGVFENVLDMSQIINYTLNKNKPLLEEV